MYNSLGHSGASFLLKMLPDYKTAEHVRSEAVYV